MKKERFKELDGLRGIAACLVMIFHFFEGHLPFVGLGSTGVDLFFIISGFVIFLSINSVSKGREFVISRVSRLYPTYWFCVVITFILVSVYAFHDHQPIHTRTFIFDLTMFQHYFFKPDLDPVYWTLIVEMTFYILILILFKLNLLKHIVPIGTLLTIILLATYPFQHNAVIVDSFFYFGLPTFFPLFFAGIVFYKIYDGVPKKIWYYLLLGLCYITQVSLYDLTKIAFRISQVKYACMLTLFFGFFILFVSNKLNFVTSRPILFLGKISFALYLTHHEVIAYIVDPLFGGILHCSFFVTATIAIACSIIAAALVNRYIEVPFSKKMKEYLKSTFLPQPVHSI